MNYRNRQILSGKYISFLAGFCEFVAISVFSQFTHYFLLKKAVIFEKNMPFFLNFVLFLQPNSCFSSNWDKILR